MPNWDQMFKPEHDYARAKLSTDESFDLEWRSLVARLRKLTAPRGHFVPTDRVPLRGPTAQGDLAFLWSEAFTFAGNSEGMDVVHVEKSSFEHTAGVVCVRTMRATENGAALEIVNEFEGRYRVDLTVSRRSGVANLRAHRGAPERPSEEPPRAPPEPKP